MSDAMKFEDYLRQKAYSYGADTRGVIIPKNIALGIASWIEQERSKNRWIPCSERLPEEDGDKYFVTDCRIANKNDTKVHISYCWLNGYGYWSDVPMGYEVTAWMPLPQAYEGDKE